MHTGEHFTRRRCLLGDLARDVHRPGAVTLRRGSSRRYSPDCAGPGNKLSGDIPRTVQDRELPPGLENRPLRVGFGYKIYTVCPDLRADEQPGGRGEGDPGDIPRTVHIPGTPESSRARGLPGSRAPGLASSRARGLEGSRARGLAGSRALGT